MKKTNITKEDINLLIVSYLTNSIDTIDIARLTLWIQANEENRRYFNLFKDAWVLSASFTGSSAGSTEQNWEVFKHKLSAPERAEGISFKKRYLKNFQIAASWLVFFVLGSVVTYYLTRNSVVSPANPVSFMVPLGARSNIILPDGSNIWLNAGTTLSYDQNFGQKERIIRLTGEAYFDVASDKERPFIVQTSGIDVHAIGTKFNIKAYPDENTISATLEEGKINVSFNGESKNSKIIKLTSKEKFIFFKTVKKSEIYTESTEENTRPKIVQTTELPDARILTNVQTELYTSWKDTRWIIEGEPLGTLAPLLERRYNLQIVFVDDELKKYKFSGTIENETVDQILNAMQLTAPLKYKITKDTIRLNLNRNYKDQFGRIMNRKNTN